MKKYLFTLLLAFAFVTPAYAANTSGYAWSESIGWFDFSNATVSDTAVTGYAYNDNTGWLVLNGITNTGGTLSGYAWSESVGYFDFSDTYIENGSFKGYAYNDNTGWLSFGIGTTVTTTWAPAVQEQPSSIGGRSRSRKKVFLTTPSTIPSVNTPLTTPTSATLPSDIIIALLTNPRDLEMNNEGADVKILQRFLNSRGFIVNATAGLSGSIGYETQYFGNLTQVALAKFQAFHKIFPSAGYFGPKTRAFIKTLITTN